MPTGMLSGGDAARGDVEGGEKSHAGVVEVEAVARAGDAERAQDVVGRRGKQAVAAERVDEDDARQRVGRHAGGVERLAQGRRSERGGGDFGRDPVARADAGPCLDRGRIPDPRDLRDHLCGGDGRPREDAARAGDAHA